MTLSLFIEYYSISDAAPSEFKEERVNRGETVIMLCERGRKEEERDGPVI